MDRYFFNVSEEEESDQNILCSFLSSILLMDLDDTSLYTSQVHPLVSFSSRHMLAKVNGVVCCPPFSPGIPFCTSRNCSINAILFAGRVLLRGQAALQIGPLHPIYHLVMWGHSMPRTDIVTSGSNIEKV